jgi:hypothetical protein
MLRPANRAEVPTVTIQNPQTTGTADIHVAALVHFDAVNRVVSRRAGHVEEHVALAECAV